MTFRIIKNAALGIVFTLLSNAPARAENWPGWRGPRGDNTSLENGLPVAWNAQTGILWKTDLPEWGNSTPAIWGEAIFLTTQHDDSLQVLKLNKTTGAIEWTREVEVAVTPRTAPKRGGQKFHELHNMATPSPVTDGKLVAVTFGTGTIAVYDFDGNLKWRYNLQDEYGKFTVWWGYGSSPVIYNGLLISLCLQDSLADLQDKPVESFIIAHDLATGKVRWRTLRMTAASAEECDTYTTPVLANFGGRTEMIVMAGNQLDAYDPAVGKQLWYLGGLVSIRTVTSPTVAGQMVYATRGKSGPMLAVKLGGHGKLPANAVAWTYDQGTPDSPCPVVINGLLFTVTDDGIARCFDAVTGHVKWKQRLKGGYKATPLVAEGRIYFLNITGLCTVISASDRFEVLTENQLPGEETTFASPAASDSRLFLRSHKALYCLGTKESPAAP